jgi:hypothetical protein
MVPNVNQFGCLMDMSDSWSREEVEAAVVDSAKATVGQANADGTFLP